MSFVLQPGHILLAALCGMVNQRQQQIFEFQNAQIEALLNNLGASNCSRRSAASAPGSKRAVQAPATDGKVNRDLMQCVGPSAETLGRH